MKELFCLLFIIVFISCLNQDTAQTPESLPQKEEEQNDTIDHFALKYDKLFLQGKFDPRGHPDFDSLSSPYVQRPNMYLHSDAYDAFMKMHADAKKKGLKLVIRSATRNFASQKSIWEAKWTGKRKLEDGTNTAMSISDPVKRARKILLYSSMPGSSRHHWGTDIDINMFENSYFENGEGLTIYTWLQENAASYGFCQVYSRKGPDRPNGYEEEKWHWSYLPLAARFTQLYAEQLTDADITGFKGSKTALEIGIVENYVLGLNPRCN